MLYVNYIEIKLGKKKTLLNQSLTSFYFPKITTVTQPNHLTLPKCDFSTPTERWSLCSIPWNLGGFVTMAEVMLHDFWGQVIKDGTASSKSLLLGIPLRSQPPCCKEAWAVHEGAHLERGWVPGLQSQLELLDEVSTDCQPGQWAILNPMWATPAESRWSRDKWCPKLDLWAKWMINVEVLRQFVRQQ